MFRIYDTRQSNSGDIVRCDPLTLGTEVYSGKFSPIIPANSSIPCRFKKITPQ